MNESCIQQDVLVWSFHVLPVSAGVFSEYSGFCPQSKNMQSRGRFIGHSELPVGVNVSMNGCSTLYMSALR